LIGSNGGGNDDDDGSMRNAETDRGDDSVNDLSEINRRGFSRRRNFSGGIRLPVD
jgi:hypothetical protein